MHVSRPPSLNAPRAPRALLARGRERAPVRRIVSGLLLPVMLLAAAPDLVQIACLHHMGEHADHGGAVTPSGHHVSGQGTHGLVVNHRDQTDAAGDAGTLHGGMGHGGFQPAGGTAASGLDSSPEQAPAPVGDPCRCAGTCVTSGPVLAAWLPTAVSEALENPEGPPAFGPERRAPRSSRPEPFRQPWPLGPPSA